MVQLPPKKLENRARVAAARDALLLARLRRAAADPGDDGFAHAIRVQAERHSSRVECVDALRRELGLRTVELRIPRPACAHLAFEPRAHENLLLFGVEVARLRVQDVARHGDGAPEGVEGAAGVQRAGNGIQAGVGCRVLARVAHVAVQLERLRESVINAHIERMSHLLRAQAVALLGGLAPVRRTEDLDAVQVVAGMKPSGSVTSAWHSATACCASSSAANSARVMTRPFSRYTTALFASQESSKK